MTQRTTVIGANMRIDGSVAGDGNVIVRGHLEGAVHIGGSLTVASGAVVRADVVAGIVLVDGCLEGKVRSAGPVRVTARGVLSGEVHGEIEVEPGGVHRGPLLRRRRAASTDFSSEVPAEPAGLVASDRTTGPGLRRARSAPPGAMKSSLRLSGPAPTKENETVRWYGEEGRSRLNEPPRRDTGPIPFAITTGEPTAVPSEPSVASFAPRPVVPASAVPAPAVVPAEEASTSPGMRGADRPLRLSAADLIADDEPPTRLGMDTSDQPLALPGVGDGDDPTDLPRGKTELMIPNPPARRTTSPGNSPIRRAFGQNTARHPVVGDPDDA
jgi:cytoskeletal protein CcmA (bactofilin family)